MRASSFSINSRTLVGTPCNQRQLQFLSKRAELLQFGIAIAFEVVLEAEPVSRKRQPGKPLSAVCLIGNPDAQAASHAVLEVGRREPVRAFLRRAPCAGDE